MKKRKIFKQVSALFFAASLIYVPKSYAATVDITSNDNILTSDLTDGDIANFTGNGTLSVDANLTLNSVTIVNNSIGIIDVSSTNALTVDNNIGAALTKINQINFSDDGTLNLKGDVFAQNGIVTETDIQGSLILSGSSAQTISSAIGSTNLKLKSIAVQQVAGVNFSDAVYAESFATSNSASALTIGGVGNLNFSDSSFNANVIINNSGSKNFGDVTLANNRTITLNSNSSFADFASGNSSSTVSIANNATLTVSGNISGSGIAKGASTGIGNILFNGASAQSVAATYKLGDNANRLGTISVSNNSTGGVTFGEDVYASALVFNQTSNASKVTIATGKTLDVNGNISASSLGSSSMVSGAGKVLLSGGAVQTITASIGSSSDRLGNLETNNDAGIVLSASNYLTTLTTSASSNLITVNGSLDSSNSAINNDTTINGIGTINLGAVTLANSKNLNLNSDVNFSSLTSGNASSAVVIASDKTLSISGNISGSGILKGTASGIGNVTFNGNTSQSVSSSYKLGDASNRLGMITVSNSVNTVTFNNDVYVSTINLNQSSATQEINIASTKSLNVSGNIISTQPSVISGSGTVTLSGNQTQTIDNSFGSGTGDRLGALTINNTSEVVLNANSHVTNLNLSNGILTLAKNITLDVSNSVDLSGETFKSRAGDNSIPFSKIVSGNQITLNPATIVDFDYSESSADFVYDGTTEYVVAQSTSGVTGAISNVIVLDNSYLFSNSLAISGNNLVTTIAADNSVLNSTNLGKANYEIISNALNYSGLGTKFVNITSASALSDTINSLKPMNNSAQTSSVISSNSNFAKIASNHARIAHDENTDLAHSIWGQALGSYSVQNERDGAVGYKENSGGFMFGIDKMFNKKNSFGIALGYTKSQITADTTSNHQIDIDSYQAVLYNSNNANQSGNGFYNNNALGISLNKYKTEREILVGNFSTTSDADFSGNSNFARIAFGYNAKVRDDFFIDPNIAIEYFSVSQDSYREKNAGDASLIVKNKSLSGYYSDLGVNMNFYRIEGDLNITPKLSLNWRHALSDYKQQSSIAFIGGGSTLDNSSIALQKDLINFGASVKINEKSDSYMELQYNLTAGDALIANSLSANFVHLF